MAIILKALLAIGGIGTSWAQVTAYRLSMMAVFGAIWGVFY